MLDFARFADKLGCSFIELIIDDRTHPAGSLLYPALQRTQGPALNVRFRGANDLPSSKLIELCDPQRGTASGLDLVSGFFFGDVLQFLTGDSLVIIDPFSDINETPRPRGEREDSNSEGVSDLEEDAEDLAYRPGTASTFRFVE